MKKTTIFLILITMLLSACNGSEMQGTQIPTEPTAKPDHTPQPSPTITPDDAAPVPADDSLAVGMVFLDVMALVKAGPYMDLHLVGSTPTPCHAVRARVHAPDSENLIVVDVYSVYDPQAVCAQMIAPFDIQVPLGLALFGTFTVAVNGNFVGEFSAPMVDG